ncbi:SDR family NAD(P)-dependent oxidoreductase [Candidimonas nitroreducens]|nr:SDR family NAD(P)-dependent oxidoreductase [Candidimonas nitroreducens]
MTKRTALVTGAASGIGWAITRSLAQDDMDLILVDRNQSIHQRVAELHEQGHSARALIADLSDLAAIQSLCLELAEKGNGCDVLVNNAGTHLKTPEGHAYAFEEASLDQWNFSLTLHMTAPFLLGKALLPGMAARGWGRVINIASRTARTYTKQGSVFYAASKAGLIGLTRSIAGEYAASGITSNAIAPGRIRTPLTDLSSDDIKAYSLRELPVGRLGEAEEIGAAASFLASDRAGFITGTVMDINGGGFMAP